MVEKIDHPIDHPLYYTSGGAKFEHVIVMERLGMVSNAFLYAATKYICRVGHKGGEDDSRDLKKAIWYLNRQLEPKFGMVVADHGAAGVLTYGNESLPAIAANEIAKAWELSADLAEALKNILFYWFSSEFDIDRQPTYLRDAVASLEREISKRETSCLKQT